MPIIKSAKKKMRQDKKRTMQNKRYELAYKKLIGKAYLYYLNGRLLHESLKEDMQAGDKIYSFYHIKNPDGEFVFIQEKKKGEFRDVSVTGGILVKFEYFENLMEHLSAINKKIKKSGEFVK